MKDTATMDKSKVMSDFANTAFKAMKCYKDYANKWNETDNEVWYTKMRLMWDIVGVLIDSAKENGFIMTVNPVDCSVFIMAR